MGLSPETACRGRIPRVHSVAAVAGAYVLRLLHAWLRRRRHGHVRGISRRLLLLLLLGIPSAQATEYGRDGKSERQQSRHAKSPWHDTQHGRPDAIGKRRDRATCCSSRMKPRALTDGSSLFAGPNRPARHRRRRRPARRTSRRTCAPNTPGHLPLRALRPDRNARHKATGCRRARPVGRHPRV